MCDGPEPFDLALISRQLQDHLPNMETQAHGYHQLWTRIVQHQSTETKRSDIYRRDMAGGLPQSGGAPVENLAKALNCRFAVGKNNNGQTDHIL